MSESVFHVLKDFSCVLLVSRGMLNRIPAGFCMSFFPGPHLSVSCTPRAFRVTRINFVPQIRFHVKRDNMLLLSPLAIQAKSFPVLSCGKERMAVGKVAAGKCGVVHDVSKMQ